MRHEYSVSQLLHRNGSEDLRRQRFRIGSMIGVEPCPLEPGYIRQPRHQSCVFAVFDEVRKIAAIFEQERRGGRGGAHMQARHRAEEVRSRNAHGRREHRRQSVDEADGDVVAIDVVALPCSLAVRPGHRCGRGAIGIEQRGGKVGRIGTLAVILLATINGRHRLCRV